MILELILCTVKQKFYNNNLLQENKQDLKEKSQKKIIKCKKIKNFFLDILLAEETFQERN
jgi:hypothetical protein